MQTTHTHGVVAVPDEDLAIQRTLGQPPLSDADNRAEYLVPQLTHPVDSRSVGQGWPPEGGSDPDKRLLFELVVGGLVEFFLALSATVALVLLQQNHLSQRSLTLGAQVHSVEARHFSAQVQLGLDGVEQLAGDFQVVAVVVEQNLLLVRGRGFVIGNR